MQFKTRIKSAKSFPELKKVILEAKKVNELKNAVIHEAIRKLTTKDCKNVKFGCELCRQIPIESFPSLRGYTLGSILNCSSQAYDFRLAHNSFKLLKSPNSYDFYYYVYSFKKAKANELCPEMIEELGSLWKKAELSGNIVNDKLLNQLFSVLSFSKEKQRCLINYLMSKPANISFTCGVLGNFLKYCFKNSDLNLAKKVWDWGYSIRERERGTFSFFQIWFQFYSLFPPSIGELKNLWSQVKNFGLDGRVELVTSMCKCLLVDVLAQREFIKDVISKEPNESFDCGPLGVFLKHCSEQNNLELARRVWSWGLDIRVRCKGTSELFQVTIQYLCICKGSGDLSLLEEVWKEAKVFGVSSYKEVLGAFINALAANGAVDRVLELFGEVPSNIVDEFILTSTLNALSHAGRDLDALNILRRVHKENPKILTVISCNSVIDAFARNGNFEMALSLIEEMKRFGIEPTAVTWTAILSPCRFYQSLPVALKAFEELQRVEHEPEDITSAHVLLADVYKSCGDLISYNQLHEHRKNRGLFKTRGGVQLCLPNSETISFYVDEIPSALEPEVCDQIFETLDDWRPMLMLEQLGLSTESVSCRHSEMLALAYAIRVLKLKRVVMRKNLRVCLVMLPL